MFERDRDSVEFALTPRREIVGGKRGAQRRQPRTKVGDVVALVQILSREPIDVRGDQHLGLQLFERI